MKSKILPALVISVVSLSAHAKTTKYVCWDYYDEIRHDAYVTINECGDRANMSVWREYDEVDNERYLVKGRAQVLRTPEQVAKVDPFRLGESAEGFQKAYLIEGRLGSQQRYRLSLVTDENGEVNFVRNITRGNWGNFGLWLYNCKTVRKFPRFKSVPNPFR